MTDVVRIGVIGAGNFTRNRLLPNLQAVPGVEITAIATRSLASAQPAAAQFAIPSTLEDWRELVKRDDVDAVLVATQPYLHHEVVMGALDAGKHVLCQTRMATSMQEAREMLNKAQETGLKHMMVPSGSYLAAGPYVKHLLDSGYVGQVRQVFCYYFTPDYIGNSAPLQRRQDHRLFGVINPLHLGIDWDALRPWLGDPTRVLAWGKAFTSRRTAGPHGEEVPVEMPDAVTAIAEMPSGTVVTVIESGVALFGEERIEIYGEEGTLVYPRRGGLLGARKDDKELRPLEIPEEYTASWHVEEDFVRLVRGEIAGAAPTFHDGVKNIEFLEAVHRSIANGGWTGLPLP